MVFAELVVLLGFVAGISGFAATAVGKLRERSDRDKEAFDAAVKALASNDYRKIDDVLILHGERLSKHIKSHLEARKDELYIERNS